VNKGCSIDPIVESTCEINSFESADSTNSLLINSPVGTETCLLLTGMVMTAGFAMVVDEEKERRRRDHESGIFLRSLVVMKLKLNGR
jgi:hypothetical protein